MNFAWVSHVRATREPSRSSSVSAARSNAGAARGTRRRSGSPDPRRDAAKRDREARSARSPRALSETAGTASVALSDRASRAVNQLLLRRQDALVDVRQRLGSTSSHETDLLNQLREVNRSMHVLRQQSRKHPKEMGRLKDKYTDLHAQVKEVTENKALLAKLLDRLCMLKELHMAKGTVARCESCQHPIAAEEIPLCAAAEDLWDVWQALLLCPRCTAHARV